MEEGRLEINCAHGKETASIICCHLLNSVDTVGFIENSSEPGDLQGWCFACEFLFQQEGDMTQTFRKFCNAKVVCEKCYETFKISHSVK